MRDARGRQGGQRLTAHRDITECGVDGVQDVGGELDVGRSGVRTDLFGTRSAGDGRGDLGATQHPGQSETSNADSGSVGDGDEALDGLQRRSL